MNPAMSSSSKNYTKHSIYFQEIEDNTQSAGASFLKKLKWRKKEQMSTTYFFFLLI
jgi:hypothetical protein